MSTSGVFVSKIVKVLINDDYLVDQRPQFVGSLGTPPADRKQWEDLHVMGISSGFEHFNKLVEEWVQRTNPSLGHLRQVLESCRCISARDSLASLGNDDTLIKISLQASTSSSPIASTAIFFGVMQPTSFFVGRDAEVDQLSQLFLNQCPPKIVVISGMGGQGKTELCRQFITTLKNQDYPPSLAWLTGDNVTNLTSSIVKLAQSLQIPATTDGRPIPLSQLLVQVAGNISQNSSGWLVVIDNVDDVYPEFKQVVPLLVRHGAFVLVTSRRIDILSGEAKLMKLDFMKEDEAHNLVKKCLNQPAAEEYDVHALCNELGNHVLALRHAVAYINAQQVENRTSYGIKNYLQDFGKDKSLLNADLNFVDGYEETIFLIVTQSIYTIYDKHGRIGSRVDGNLMFHSSRWDFHPMFAEISKSS